MVYFANGFDNLGEAGGEVGEELVEVSADANTQAWQGKETVRRIVVFLRIKSLKKKKKKLTR